MSRRLKFHSDWFTEHESSYREILAPRLAKLPSPPKAWVIGSVEGRSVEWLLTHMTRKGPEIVVLEEEPTHDAKLRCVATRGIGVRVSDVQVRNTLKANLKELQRRRPDATLRLVEKETTSGLIEIAAAARDGALYDVILIDAQSSRHALECAVVAFTVLKPRGVMVFTNYTHGATHDAACPRRGIDGFLDAYASEIQLLRIAFHLFLERRIEPMKLPLPCHAEVSDPDPDPEPEKACRRKTDALEDVLASIDRLCESKSIDGYPIYVTDLTPLNESNDSLQQLYNQTFDKTSDLYDIISGTHMCCLWLHFAKQASTRNELFFAIVNAVPVLDWLHPRMGHPEDDSVRMELRRCVFAFKGDDILRAVRPPDLDVPEPGTDFKAWAAKRRDYEDEMTEVARFASRCSSRACKKTRGG